GDVLSLRAVGEHPVGDRHHLPVLGDEEAVERVFRRRRTVRGGVWILGHRRRGLGLHYTNVCTARRTIVTARVGALANRRPCGRGGRGASGRRAGRGPTAASPPRSRGGPGRVRPAPRAGAPRRPPWRPGSRPP